MYDREGSRNQQKIGAYFRTVKDIAEEDENEVEQTASIFSTLSIPLDLIIVCRHLICPI